MDCANSSTNGAWNNTTDTTEMGACACCLATLEFSREPFAVRRAETGTGADDYIAPAGSGVDDLEDCHRIGISGVDAGAARDVRQRLIVKVQQARKGNSSLPAVTAMVGFAARLIVLADVDLASVESSS